jgi:hypothetical protein
LLAQKKEAKKKAGGSRQIHGQLVSKKYKYLPGRDRYGLRFRPVFSCSLMISEFSGKAENAVPARPYLLLMIRRTSSSRDEARFAMLH